MYLEMSGFNNCEIVGKPTHRYNCIAWAFGDDTRWWWPAYGAFWPEECLVEDEIYMVLMKLNHLKNYLNILARKKPRMINQRKVM